MFRCFLLLVFFITCLPCFSLVQAETKNKSTIAAPYFYVEDESIPLEHFPLKDTRVEAVIGGVIANVTVTQVYGNTGDRPINARYVFPGSTHAAIHGMTMTIGERRIHAQIKEKNEAKKIFDTAKNEGKNASLLKQHRPNVFSMDVANIMPGDEIAIELNYSEILSPQDATYTFVYPAVVGPRYNDKADLSDEETSWLMNPYLPEGKAARTDFSLDLKLESGIPIHDIRCASHDPKVVFQSEKNVTIHIDSRKEFAGNRDFILNYRLQGKQIESGLLVYQGEKENYFLLMAQPPETHNSNDIPPREYLFVVDVSGSMSGFPLDTAKILLTSLLSELRPTDMFNLVLFAGSSELLSNYSLPANNEEIQRAIHLINTHKGGGGTNLLNALQQVTALPKQEGFSRSTIVITDGYIFAEREIFETIEQDLDNNNFFTFGIGSSVNRHLIETMARCGLGESFVATNKTEAREVSTLFREYISAPLLTDLHLENDAITTYDLEPEHIPDLFAKRPVLVFGKYTADAGRQGTITLHGKYGKKTFTKTFSLGDATFINDPGLQYLWARTRITRLSDYGQDEPDPEHKAEITTLGLTHGLITPYTSFVAVDEIIRNHDKKSDNVKQPLPLPKGVSNAAISAPMNKVPEPELYLFIPLILLAAYLHLFRRKTKR